MNSRGASWETACEFTPETSDYGLRTVPSSGALTRAAMGRFLVSQIAAVAELEAGLIGQRTKAALAAAKARGVVLAGWRVGR